MKILLIDQASNAVDLATRVARNDRCSHVYLIAPHTCPRVWGNERLTVLEDVARTQEIYDLVRRQSIDLVANLSPLHGSTGLVEYLAEREIAAIGSNRAFSETEIDKRGFKRWLVENRIPTPRIRDEGRLNDIRARREQYAYPLVVKPDLQVGPATAVVSGPDDLLAYFQKVEIATPAAASGLIFMIEDCLPGGPIIQVLYAIASGRGCLISSMKMAVVPKTEETPTGAVFAVLPWGLLEQYRSQLEGIIDRLARSIECKAIGSLQCMLGPDGILYVIENNARPAACCLYDPWNDCHGALLDLLAGDVDAVAAAAHGDLEKHFWLAAGLIHPQPSVSIGEARFKELTASGSVRPFSFRRDVDGFTTAHGRMPSAMMVSSVTRQSAVDAFNEQFEHASSILPLLPARADTAVFD